MTKHTPPWLQNSSIIRLFAAIPDAAAQLRFVGGCVRDSLAGERVQDIDLATTYPPEDIINFLKAQKIKVIPTGIQHGTVMAVVDGHPFEITTLRRDVETDGRHAVVAFTDCWQEDAARRDFTFNALYLTIDGVLFDPFQGAEDLKNGIVRFIGEPAQRIQEDYLRILRYFRFYARYSQTPPDDALIKTLRDHTPGLMAISGERIQSELFKLLRHPTPLDALRIMERTGVFHLLFQAAQIPTAFESLLKTEEHYGLTPHVLTRLYNLLENPAHQLPWIKDRFKLPNKDATFLSALFTLETTTDPLKILLHFQGAELTLAHLLVKHAKANTRPSPKDLQMIRAWIPRKFPLTGDDLLREGYKPGSALGQELKKRERAWVLEKKD